MAEKKGKLFGKLNIVDLIVIVVIVIAVIFVGMKFLGGRDSDSAAGTGKTRLVYTVLVENVKPEVYENIKTLVDAGDATLMASGEMLDGRVVSVSATPHEDDLSIGIEDKTVVIPLGRELLDLTFTIDCNVVNTVTNEVGTQEVRIGKNHIVKTDKFELVGGVVLSCRWGEDAA